MIRDALLELGIQPQVGKDDEVSWSFKNPDYLGDSDNERIVAAIVSLIEALK
jgi:hypothetical protein